MVARIVVAWYLLVAAPSVHAICGHPYLLGLSPKNAIISNPDWCGGPTFCTGYGGPLDNCSLGNAKGDCNAVWRLEGSFWAMSDGDPALFAGDDNGGFTSDGWLLEYSDPEYAYYRPAALNTATAHWAASFLIDGCAGNGNTGADWCTCLAFSDVDPDGHSYFALLADRRDVLANHDFSPWVTGSVVTLAPIPRPTVLGAVRAGDGFELDVLVERPVEGLSLDPECEACGEIRYHVYARSGSFDEVKHPDRELASWTKLTADAADAGTVTAVHVECDDSSPWISIAATLVFDSGFETAFVSRPSGAPIRCRPDRERPLRGRVTRSPRPVHALDRGG